MKLRLRAALLAAVLTGSALAGPIDEVRPLATAFDQAQVDKDAAVLDRSMADDLVFIRGSGRVADKKSFMEGFTAPAFKLDPFEIKDHSFTELNPDVVVASGEVTLTGTDGDEAFSEHIRFSDVWAKRGDTWKVVYIQVTMIPPAK
ncbi:hypothetical protein sos41_04450 [Alphaproteobacteria bacterium SO-S41]|nr:hypothetical protein sos41_04450 [Alphaproteobacteria bacterium SO-S41]